MAISLNDNIRTEAPKPSDDWRGPYIGNSEAEALAAACNQVTGVKNSVRYLGRQVDLIIAGITKVYFWEENLLDSGLVPLFTPSTTTDSLSFTPGGGANALKLVGFNEFSEGTTVKTDRFNKPLNANYDYNIKGLDLIDCKTDSSNVLRTYISRITQIEYLVSQPLWYMTIKGSTNVDTTKIYPALGNIYKVLDPSLNQSLSSNQYLVNGQFYNTVDPSDPTAVKILESTTLQGGTPSDDGFVEFQRLKSNLGYKVAISPYIVGINEDIIAPGSQENPQIWRGYLTPDSSRVSADPSYILISDFTSFCLNYYNFSIYYPTLLYNSSVQLDLFYIGSEMAGISTTIDETKRRLWITTLIKIAKYIKGIYPNCIVTYSADWQGEIHDSLLTEFTLDELLSSKYIDNVGFNYFPSLTEVATDDEGSIAQSMISGEDFDYTLIYSSDPTDPTSLSYQQKLTTTSGEGKINLQKTSINSIGDKNIAGFLNSYHYNSNASGLASTTLLSGDDLTLAFTGPSGNFPTILFSDSTSIVPEYSGTEPLLFAGYTVQYGEKSTLDSCFTTLTSKGAKFTYKYLNLDEFNRINIITRIKTSTVLPVGIVSPVLLYLTGRCKIYFDTTNTNTLTILWTLDDNSTQIYITPIIWIADTLYDISIVSVSNTRIVYEINTVYRQIIAPSGRTFKTSWSTNATVQNDFYIGIDDSSNFLNCKLSYFELSEPNFGYACFFEEKYSHGTRTSFIPKLGILGEFGAASIDASVVQTNGVVNTLSSSIPPSLDFSSFSFLNNQDFWSKLSENRVFVNEVYGPYGSKFNINELGQVLITSAINNFLLVKNFNIRCLYYADLRMPESLNLVQNGLSYYRDIVSYIFGHNIVGKLIDKTGNQDVVDRVGYKKDPIFVGQIIQSKNQSNSPTGTDLGSVSISNFVLTGTTSGNTTRDTVSTGISAVVSQSSNGTIFSLPSSYDFKPLTGSYPKLNSDGSYTNTSISFSLDEEVYNVPVSEVLLENNKFTKTSISQYTINATISVIPGYSLSPVGIGVGIKGKSISYLTSSSYLIVNFSDGKLYLKTRRSKSSGTIYQLNSDEDLVSSDSLTIDLTQDFVFSYRRESIGYFWSVTHNNSTIYLTQPDLWEGGGKMGRPSIINFGGSFLVKEFNVDYNLATNLNYYVIGSDQTEDNQKDVLRNLPENLNAFNAADSNRAYDYLNGGLDDTNDLVSTKYVHWDLGSGLNWSQIVPSDYPLDSSVNPTVTTLSLIQPDYYTIDDQVAPAGNIVTGDKTHNFQIIDKLCQLTGVQNVFITTLSPNNGVTPYVRELNSWVFNTFGPDSSYINKSKIVFIDTFKVLNNPDPTLPLTNQVLNTDGSLTPSSIDLDLFGGLGYQNGYSENNLLPSILGYQKKTEAELNIKRPYIEALISNITYVSAPQLSAPSLSFTSTSSTITLSWLRQASLDTSTVVNYYITSDNYSNIIYQGIGLTYTLTGLDPSSRHTFSIVAKSTGYLDSPSNNYLTKTTS